MKRTNFSILILSLLLTVLTACGAQAKQPDEPAPTLQADQIELAQPVQLSEPEKTEISQEELESIFETVYTSASESHPEDWGVDFQITDEIGKINSAIPDDKHAPSDLRTIYIDWRAAKVDTAPATIEEEPAPENPLTFTDCNETVYATSTVNLRSGPSTDYEKIGSLSAGDSVTRIGIGTGTAEGWSKIQLSDGSIVYVSSKYVSTTKPATQQSSSQTTKPSGGQTNTSGSQTSTPSSGGKSMYGGFNTYEEYINNLQKKFPDLSLEEIKSYFPDLATGYVDEAAAEQSARDNNLG